MSQSRRQEPVWETIQKFIHEHPGTAIAATNAVTASVFLYSVAQRHGGIVPALKKALFAGLKAVPGAQGLIDKETAKMAQKIEDEVLGDMSKETRLPTLPYEPMSKDEIIEQLKSRSEREKKIWKSGKISGCVYHGGEDLLQVISAAYKDFCLANPLHPDVFPSTRRMEAEVVSWTVNLFHGGPDACGTMTSGGTESILMACRAYRDMAREQRGVVTPNMVIPVTAHAAFDKACDYFGIELRHVAVDAKTFRADVKAMAKRIDKNTIMLVGSAPNFPQGVIDPISELSQLALTKKIPLHVDCCLGSLLIAHAEAAGYTMPEFDFRVPGVTSISADTHKYGYGPKGSSVIMYKNPSYRKYQYYVAPSWTGGIYASPTIAGSRAGGVIAGTWAAMINIGGKGYVDAARLILSAAKTIAAGVASIPGIQLYGKPDLSVICIGPATGSDTKANIHALSDALGKRGWNLNVLQNPACFHLCLTRANAEEAERTFLRDLEECTMEVLATPELYKDGMGAMYGMAASLPDKAPVKQLAQAFIDVLYKV